MQIYNLRKLKNYRQELRTNMPRAEIMLWKYLKGRQLNNCKFRRQHSIGNYIIDFYCPEKRLVIELDGESHYNDLSKRQYDQKRDEYLTKENIKVLRFLNTDIYTNLVGVLEEIKKYL